MNWSARRDLSKSHIEVGVTGPAPQAQLEYAANTHWPREQQSWLHKRTGSQGSVSSEEQGLPVGRRQLAIWGQELVSPGKENW